MHTMHYACESLMHTIHAGKPARSLDTRLGGRRGVDAQPVAAHGRMHEEWRGECGVPTSLRRGTVVWLTPSPPHHPEVYNMNFDALNNTMPVRTQPSHHRKPCVDHPDMTGSTGEMGCQLLHPLA